MEIYSAFLIDFNSPYPVGVAFRGVASGGEADRGYVTKLVWHLSNFQIVVTVIFMLQT